MASKYLQHRNEMLVSGFVLFCCGCCLVQFPTEANPLNTTGSATTDKPTTTITPVADATSTSSLSLQSSENFRTCRTPLLSEKLDLLNLLAVNHNEWFVKKIDSDGRPSSTNRHTSIFPPNSASPRRPRSQFSYVRINAVEDDHNSKSNGTRRKQLTTSKKVNDVPIRVMISNLDKSLGSRDDEPKFCYEIVRPRERKRLTHASALQMRSCATTTNSSADASNATNNMTEFNLPNITQFTPSPDVSTKTISPSSLALFNVHVVYSFSQQWFGGSCFLVYVCASEASAGSTPTTKKFSHRRISDMFYLVKTTADPIPPFVNSLISTLITQSYVDRPSSPSKTSAGIVSNKKLSNKHHENGLGTVVGAGASALLPDYDEEDNEKDQQNGRPTGASSSSTGRDLNSILRQSSLFPSGNNVELKVMPDDGSPLSAVSGTVQASVPKATTSSSAIVGESYIFNFLVIVAIFFVFYILPILLCRREARNSRNAVGPGGESVENSMNLNDSTSNLDGRAGEQPPTYSQVVVDEEPPPSYSNYSHLAHWFISRPKSALAGADTLSTGGNVQQPQSIASRLYARTLSTNLRTRAAMLFRTLSTVAPSAASATASNSVFSHSLPRRTTSTATVGGTVAMQRAQTAQTSSGAIAEQQLPPPFSMSRKLSGITRPVSAVPTITAVVMSPIMRFHPGEEPGSDSSPPNVRRHIGKQTNEFPPSIFPTLTNAALSSPQMTPSNVWTRNTRPLFYTSPLSETTTSTPGVELEHQRSVSADMEENTRSCSKPERSSASFKLPDLLQRRVRAQGGNNYRQSATVASATFSTANETLQEKDEISITNSDIKSGKTKIPDGIGSNSHSKNNEEKYNRSDSAMF